MTKNPFDQFSKQLFEAFLAPLGEVRINYEVPGEPRFIDILFAPFPQPHTNPQELGLLSRIASVPCLLEPYRNQPNLPEIRSCLQKLFFVQSNFQREANREDQRLDEEQLPRQWIITPTVSDRILNNFGGNLRSDWLDGIYFFVEGLKTAIIAVNSLPPTPETLLFRILGRGKVQRQALSEILALPRDDNRRCSTKLTHSYLLSRFNSSGVRFLLQCRESAPSTPQAFSLYPGQQVRKPRSLRYLELPKRLETFLAWFSLLS